MVENNTLIYSFGFLISIDLNEKFVEAVKAEKMKRQEELKCKENKEENKEESKSTEDVEEYLGRARVCTEDHYIYLPTRVSSFLYEHKELSKEDVSNDRGYGEPTHILVHDYSFEIRCPSHSWDNEVRFGEGIEKMLKQVEKKLRKRSDFIEAEKFFGIAPVWHTVFGIN